jgi:hypothetical protein
VRYASQLTVRSLEGEGNEVVDAIDSERAIRSMPAVGSLPEASTPGAAPLARRPVSPLGHGYERRHEVVPVNRGRQLRGMRRMGMPSIGHRQWAIAEGYVPAWSHGPAPEMESHETACLLNAGDEDAQVEITLFFADREPVGPYRVTVPARRTLHLRFNDLTDPAPVPRGTPYASVIRSDQPIVVQHTRLDTRQADNALATTVAFPVA